MMHLYTNGDTLEQEDWKLLRSDKCMQMLPNYSLLIGLGFFLAMLDLRGTSTSN